MERQASHLVPLVEGVLERLRPPRLPPGPPRVAFYPYVETKSTIRDRGDHLYLRISDHLDGAPEQVLEGIVAILACRLWGLPETRADAEAVAAYEAYVADAARSERRSRSRTERGRKHIEPVGTHRSLLASYLRVTMEMDLAVPTAPRLSWSQRDSRRRFGHWDADHNAIVISRALDDPAVPEFVLDYVVHHEVLHIVHPPKAGAPGARRHVHPPEFTAAERRFPRWQEAEAWLARLARRRAARRAR